MTLVAVLVAGAVLVAVDRDDPRVAPAPAPAGFLGWVDALVAAPPRGTLAADASFTRDVVGRVTVIVRTGAFHADLVAVDGQLHREQEVHLLFAEDVRDRRVVVLALRLPVGREAASGPPGRTRVLWLAGPRGASANALASVLTARPVPGVLSGSGDAEPLLVAAVGHAGTGVIYVGLTPPGCTLSTAPITEPDEFRPVGSWLVRTPGTSRPEFWRATCDGVVRAERPAPNVTGQFLTELPDEVVDAALAGLSCEDSRDGVHALLPHPATRDELHALLPHPATRDELHALLPHPATRNEFHALLPHPATRNELHALLPHPATRDELVRGQVQYTLAELLTNFALLGEPRILWCGLPDGMAAAPVPTGSTVRVMLAVAPTVRPPWAGAISTFVNTPGGASYGSGSTFRLGADPTGPTSTLAVHLPGVDAATQVLVLARPPAATVRLLPSDGGVGEPVALVDGAAALSVRPGTVVDGLRVEAIDETGAPVAAVTVAADGGHDVISNWT